MTDLARRSDALSGPSIDLRDGDQGPARYTPSDEHPITDPPPSGSGPEPSVETDPAAPLWLPPEDDDTAQGGPSRSRNVVLAILLAILAVVCLEVFLLPVAYHQRQDHRADEYRDPKANLNISDAAFVLQAPTIQLDEVVVKGATPVLLRGGPGWRVGSAPPGQGNTVILGHSTRWGYPFGRIDDLKAGNPIYLRTRDGHVYVYRVTKVRTVPDSATKVMDPTGPSRLTLITSAGGPLDGRRVVVQAGVRGPQPAVPGRLKEKVVAVKNPGAFDERGSGGLLLLVSGVAVIAIGAYGFLELRHRYRLFTVFIVAGPAIALGVVLLLFDLDAFLPVTF